MTLYLLLFWGLQELTGVQELKPSPGGSVLADETETYLLIAYLILHWSTPSPRATTNTQSPPSGSWRMVSFASFVSLARGHGHGAGCALNLWHRTFIGQISVHLHACIKTNGRELPEVLH